MKKSDVWILPDIAYFFRPARGVAAVRRAVLPRTHCPHRAWGGSLNKHETTHFRRSGNEWFLHFVYTNALLAPLQNIEFCKDHFTNQTCFVGGDSGPCSIMLIHLSNFHFMPPIPVTSGDMCIIWFTLQTVFINCTTTNSKKQRIFIQIYHIITCGTLTCMIELKYISKTEKYWEGSYYGIQFWVFS